jgi:DNA-binding transcriptional LysR family regulator
MSLPFYLSVPAIIAATDMITTISERVASLLPWPGVHSFPIPLDYSGYNETMLWHRRNDGDAGHGWLRRIISAESEKLAANSTGAMCPLPRSLPLASTSVEFRPGQIKSPS